MTVRPWIQMGNNILQDVFPDYRAFYRDTSKWLERNVSLQLPQALVYTVDKIIYLFDLLIPEILAVAATVIGGLALDLTLATMAPGLIPLIAYCLYDIFSKGLYPYDHLRDLNQAALKREFDTIVAPEHPLLDRIGAHLGARNHVMLVAPAGRGKTSAIFSMARVLESPSCPSILQGKRIYHLDLDGITDDPYNTLRRILILVNELNIATAPNAILFIDEAHRMSDRVNGLKLSDFLKPFLATKYIHVIAATTDDECEKLFKDKAIARRFERVSMDLKDQEVQEPEDTENLPQQLIDIVRSNSAWTSDAAIIRAIRQAKHVLPTYALPDSAIKVIRGTSAMISYEKTTEPHTQTFSMINPEDIDRAIKKGFVERVYPPKPSPTERMAIALERQLASKALELH